MLSYVKGIRDEECEMEDLEEEFGDFVFSGLEITLMKIPTSCQKEIVNKEFFPDFLEYFFKD